MAVPEDTKQSQQKNFGFANFWHELRRRHVVRIATVYLIVAWLVIQVASTTFSSFGIPTWAFRMVVLMVALGFPISLIVAWAFELTPEGLKTTKSAQANIEQYQVAKNTAFHKKRSKLSIIFAAVIPSTIFGSLAIYFYLSGNTSQQASKVDNVVMQSIAVLPFINMSAISENAFFASGVHEDVLTNLSHIENLHVTSRTSATRYIDTKLTMPEIGKELRVRYILEGSVRRIDNYVRVTVQLIDTLTDTHLWANNYDRELVDVFAVQSAIAKDISNALHLELQPDTVKVQQGLPTRSIKAYDYFIKAQSIERSIPETEDTLLQQYELLVKATEEDPSYVQAWGFLNEVCDHLIRNINQLAWFANDNQQLRHKTFTRQAKVALDKAISLEPNNVETLLAMASDSVAELKPEFRLERKKTIDKALALYPENAMVWYVLGWWHNLGGNIAEADAAFIKALEFDPIHARILNGALIHFQGNSDAKIASMLFERLDKTLNKADDFAKLANIYLQLLGTADESLIAQIYQPSVEINAYDSLMSFWLFNNNYEQALQVGNNATIAEGVSLMPSFEYFQVKARTLNLYQFLGDETQANRIATEILDAQQYLPEIIVISKSGFDAILAQAYYQLGNTEKYQQLATKILNNNNTNYDTYHYNKFLLLNATDTNAAAKLIISHKDSKLFYSSINNVALNHIYFRKLLLHPDIEKYLVEQNKWLKYLSTRVPEYEKYKNN
ncbi:hypothetical protein RGQ13_05480 [Thalassotalea psychrophila]|uniref:Adenylate cyclase n=1 Tax=Thalassotalea psychrophila TaxID=3065647 RepID=A0ABY9TXB7_9GAMM|nr:hypothetical protein RGQ13_05480 [Colwelliaceae bacterium SQ149]